MNEMMIGKSCHHCKTSQQCEWTMVRCSKGMYCRESFCFTCLSKEYPSLYSHVFTGICWACPACLGACKCEVCSDPVKRQELQDVAHEMCMRERAFLAAERDEFLSSGGVVQRERTPLIQPASYQQPIVKVIQDEVPKNGWSCPMCSAVNNSADVECSTCLFHKKRSRKRAVYTEPANYEEKHAVKKDRSKRAREIPYDDKSPPAKGRVVALRQLVKEPWTDGWGLARRLALDLVEEAKQLAIKQGIAVSEMRQLPTKFQLANTRGSHVRKWFDREPTLAKKFMRAAGLICSKSNGTFIKEDITSLEDMPFLIMQADLSKCDDEGALSDDGEEIIHTSENMASENPTALLPSSPSTAYRISPAFGYQPKLKVYYHRLDYEEPFVFKVPITDLKTIDELRKRLIALLQEMGQPTTDSIYIGTDPINKYSSQMSESTTFDDLAKCSFIHAHSR